MVWRSPKILGANEIRSIPKKQADCFRVGTVLLNISLANKVKKNALSKVSAAELNLAFNLLQTARSTDEKMGFHWEGDVFYRPGISSVDCTSFTSLDPEIKESLKKTWLEYAFHGQYANTTIMGATQAIRFALSQFPTKTFDIEWVFRALTVTSIRSFKGPILNFFLFWKERHKNVITEDALYHFSKANVTSPRSRSVLSDNPELSWLTDIEYDAVLRTVWNSYDTNKIGTQVALMRLLSMQYARRPAQLAQLKIRDFQSGVLAKSGSKERQVSFPGVKDQLAPNGFRDSKFEAHPIADHLWDLFEIHCKDIVDLFEHALKFSLTKDELSDAPLFTSARQISKAVAILEGRTANDVRSHLGSELFHLVPSSVSKILHWEKNPSLTGYLDKVGLIETPISHRTGNPIVVTATRMRHTRARQLARLGMPKHVLSFWLGHTSEKTLDAYYNDPAEEARMLNESMSTILTPLALAYTGKLIDKESQATRADDPESTLEFSNNRELTNVGSCGKHSFCATTTVPIACYRCRHFEPLVHAPHQEVLNALKKRQSEEEEIVRFGGHRKLLVPIDLSADIRAVESCINRCNARKFELGQSSE